MDFTVQVVVGGRLGFKLEGVLPEDADFLSLPLQFAFALHEAMSSVLHRIQDLEERK